MLHSNEIDADKKIVPIVINTYCIDQKRFTSYEKYFYFFRN